MGLNATEEPARVTDYARVLNELWLDTIREPELSVLAYFIGMAALVAADEAARRPPGDRW